MTRLAVGLEPATHWGRPAVAGTVEVGGTTAADLEALLDGVEAGLAAHGLALADVVRTRLRASSRAARDAASRVRFARLAGPARCATSSYIDTGAPGPAGWVALDVLALPGAGAVKVVEEYEPRQPPCRSVTAGDEVLLSGHTSLLPDWPAQVADVRDRIAASLDAAGARLGRHVAALDVTVYVDRSVDRDALVGLPALLGVGEAPCTVVRCDGFSAPGKLLEAEVNARAS